MKRRNIIEFDVDAWLTDPNLRACSVEARGLWIDMLCQMRKCPERGVLKTGNLAWTFREVAAAFGLDWGRSKRLLAELVEKGVTTLRSEDKAYTNRRMLKHGKVASELPTLLLAGQNGGESGQNRPHEAICSSTSLSFNGKFLKVKTVDHEENRLRYPTWDLQAAYEHIDDWCATHPAKFAKKKDIAAFVRNWLRNAPRLSGGYERGGRIVGEAAVGRGPQEQPRTLEQERLKWRNWIAKREKQLADQNISAGTRERWEQELRVFRRNLAECEQLISGRAN